MSVEAITWALKQPIPVSSAKFVLVVLANHANEEQLAYPSVAYLVNATSQNRKTVLANLERLCEWKLIERTDERIGDTGRIVVYRLLASARLFELEIVPKTESSQKRDHSKNGTIGACAQLAKSCGKAVASAGNGPKNGTLNKERAFKDQLQLQGDERLKQTLDRLEAQRSCGELSSTRYAKEVRQAVKLAEKAHAP
jgi:pyocin large subunit-like protein